MAEVEAGRELDVLINQHVMHRPLTEICDYYSTDIAAAWQVVEHLRKQRFSIFLTLVDPSFGVYAACLPENKRIRCQMSKQNQSYIDDNGERVEVADAYGDTAPLAICRAALKAVAENSDVGAA